MSPAALLDGEPAPADGSLPPHALAGVEHVPFGFYVHVPYCATRCGYCDFNTYTARELGAEVRQETYAATVAREVVFARRVVATDIQVSSVFFGGGTPTLLPAADLASILRQIDGQFGLATGAEVTTEANPESVDPRYLEALRAAGFTRISFGMQSAAAHVLRTLDRQHTPGRPQQCVTWARAAGFTHVNLDLIYGTPGESDADWQATLTAALAAEPDHISAYSLIVEPGTRLAARIRRGELPGPDEDALADRYVMADDQLAAAGFAWYEVSNWAREPSAHCRHNLIYWRGANWWGAGPGAHSHIGGLRWWNVKHPATYTARIAAGVSPAHAREVLTGTDRKIEDIMLRVRLADGFPLADLSVAGRAAATRAVASGLAAASAYDDGRVVLTRRGRLLADAVIRELT